MTTTTWSTVFTNNSDANFRAWGGGLSTALAAVGMVKTSDTGQINWTTVTAPLASNTQQGYEIWRFNDSLQATAPIFLRIGYGSGSAAATPSLWMTIGKASDGAGTITGVIQTVLQGHCGVNNASVFTSYASCSDGVLAFSLAPAIPTMNNSVWVVERSRDNTGTATSTGVMYVTPPSNGVAGVFTYGYSYASATSNAGLSGFPVGLPAFMGNNVGMAVSGASPVFAATVYVNGFIWQPRGIVVGARLDVGTLAVFTVPGWGTYLSLGLAGQKCDAAGSAYSTACIAWA